jgi:uncharacterized membrane protein YqhA
MLRYFLPLRLLMLLACLWALLGAILMFGLAGAKLAHAADALWMSGFEHANEVAASVMGATDASLFGVVLIIFSYAITFGFVFELSSRARERLPEWMQIQNISELKRSLIEVIIVYLVVDFATDLASQDSVLDWANLVKPASIALIAATLRLMTIPHPPEHGRSTDEGLQSVPSREHESVPVLEKRLRS